MATSLNETVISKTSSISNSKDRCQSNQTKNVVQNSQNSEQQQPQQQKEPQQQQQQRKKSPSIANMSEYLLDKVPSNSNECSAKPDNELPDEDVTIRDELKYRVESPHKLSKSEPDGYKFASNSSMNWESHRQRHKLLHEHFELYQSSYFSTS